MWNLFHARHFKIWLDIKPESGHRILMQTFPGGIMSGMDYYQNDAGIVVCETTLDQTAFNPDGSPLCSRIRRALQDSDSIDDVVAILSEQNNGLYSNEWLMADMKTDEIAMFELGTGKTHLWRSGKNDWFAGVEGFYWGCNNAKDLQVRLETVPGVEGKPVNVVYHPADRDRAWLKLYDQWKGRIDAGFGFEAFTTPPLSAWPSLDAKFTTAEMARRLETYAVFGPPRGNAWLPTDTERERYPEIGPLLPHDWTLLSAQEPPSPSAGQARAVDLDGESKRDNSLALDARRPPAWHGTILPASDADLWLAASFAEYERIVALEKALAARSSGDRHRGADRDRMSLALFGPMSRYLAARARRGSDLAFSDVKLDVRSDAWYDIASGKGVMVLDALRKQVGPDNFDAAADEFGRAHAGEPVSSAAFLDALARTSGQPIKPSKAAWLGTAAVDSLDASVAERFRQGRFWSVISFYHDPDRVKIVYRTASDANGNREAAHRLQHLLRRRWSNLTMPVVADSELRQADLAGSHLILIGEPGIFRRETDRARWPGPVRKGVIPAFEQDVCESGQCSDCRCREPRRSGLFGGQGSGPERRGNLESRRGTGCVSRAGGSAADRSGRAGKAGVHPSCPASRRGSIPPPRRSPPMTRPTPEPVDPKQVEALAKAVLQADRFPHLATIDGDQPRVRPVSPVRTDGFTIYVANLRALS